MTAEWRSTGVKPPELEQPELPEYAKTVWQYFLNLHNTERNGNARLSAQQMQSWEWKTGNTLTLWERRAITAMDNTWYQRSVK